MLKVNHIDHINIFVKSLERSVAFYQKHFGFKVYEKGVGFSTQNPYRIIGISGKIMLCLYEQKDDVNISGFNHIGLHIQNFDEAINYIKQQELVLLYGGINQYEKSRSMYIADPDGYEIELSETFAGGLGD